MSGPELRATIVEAAIPFFFGWWMWIVSRRKKPGDDPVFDRRYGAFGAHMKWIGPVLMAFGFLQAVRGVCLAFRFGS